jgi:hypothetical protein
MSQGDYIRAKREIRQTRLDAMQALPSIMDAGIYIESKGRAIACSVRGTTLRVSQILPSGRYEEFGMERNSGVYATATCPEFMLCVDTNTRANRVLATTPVFSAPLYLSARYYVTTQPCDPCCYDAGSAKTGTHARDSGACANARKINVMCTDSKTLC